MTIGQKIKELRKKNNMTQEKLAEYLTVSFQAVSKWENGAACPDISLVEPLTKIFNVSADELLCIKKSEPDTRREELERLYKQTFDTEDFAERQRICEEAVKEYPGDMEYLCNLAWVVSNRSFEYEDNEKYIFEQERAIKLFDSVIRNCRDEYLRGNAVIGITQLLSWRGRLDEAKSYAMMLQEKTSVSRDAVWEYCISGDELIRFKHERIFRHLEGIINDLSLMPYKCFTDTIEEILKVMFPDGNYIEMNLSLYYAKLKQIRRIMRSEAFDTVRVIELLKEASHFASAYDSVVFDSPGVYRYTSEWFDLIETDTREWIGSQGTRIADDFRKFLSEPLFDKIRCMDEFKNL